MDDNRPLHPVPVGICGKCNRLHDPDKCHAHAKRQGGNQCQRPPTAGMTVCDTHGGKSPAAKAAREERAATAVVANAAAIMYRRPAGGFRPVTNALEELNRLAGEALHWKEGITAWIEQLKSVRYGTDGGEAIRGEVILYERALDRCHEILVSIAKLNIDERLVAIEQGRKEMVLSALDAGFQAAGLTGEQATIARLAAAKRLRVISGTTDRVAASVYEPLAITSS
jgi:hypothetical protein